MDRTARAWSTRSTEPLREKVREMDVMDAVETPEADVLDPASRRMVSLEDASRVLGIRRETLKRWYADGAFTREEFHQLYAVRGRGHAWEVDLDAAKREHARRWTPARVRADAPVAVSFLPAHMLAHDTPSQESPSARPTRRVASPASPRPRRDTKPLAPRPQFDLHAPIPQVPTGWVTVASFWKTHGGKKNWAGMWRDRMYPKGPLHIETGLWLDGNRTVMYLLAPQGQRDMGVAYGQKDWWIACDDPDCYACTSLRMGELTMGE
jgi:hypothetical protein